MDRHRSRIYAMITVFGEEKWKPIIHFGIEQKPYIISKGCEIINSDTGKKLKQALLGNKNNYGNQYWGCNINGKTVTAHRLGMETWKPLDDYPPAELADTWNDVPEPWREWVRRTAWVDHQGDKITENHVDKMAWVTPRQNSKYYKEAQAGNPGKNELARRKRNYPSYAR